MVDKIIFRKKVHEFKVASLKPYEYVDVRCQGFHARKRDNMYVFYMISTKSTQVIDILNFKYRMVV